jgi:hypothetical protein
VLAGTIDGLDLQAARSNLMILARHHQDPDADFPDFGNADAQDGVLRLIRSYRPDVVILDNLSTLATLDDENGAAETQRFVRLLTRLKQARIAAIVVHHSGKSGSAFRGSSMLATTFEVILGLTREPGGDVLDPNGQASFLLKWDKYRGRRDPTVGNREVALRETYQGLRWTAERPRDEVLAALATLVRSGQYSTRADVGGALPEHLWPTPGKPPSTGWVSNKFALMHAQGVMKAPEVDAFLKAAREDEHADPMHDDL